MLLFIFFLAGITKAAAKLHLSQEAKQEQHPHLVKPTLSSYPSNGQIHSQYHGYYVKADVKVPPPDEPLIAEDDFHPSSLGRLPPPVKEGRAPPPRSSPSTAPANAPAEASRPKRLEPSRPKSLAETKKTSVEIVPENTEEETVSWIPAGWLFHLDPGQYLSGDEGDLSTLVPWKQPVKAFFFFFCARSLVF